MTKLPLGGEAEGCEEQRVPPPLQLCLPHRTPARSPELTAGLSAHPHSTPHVCARFRIFSTAKHLKNFPNSCPGEKG